jgi:hypothetical protein
MKNGGIVKTAFGAAGEIPHIKIEHASFMPASYKFLEPVSSAHFKKGALRRLAMPPGLARAQSQRNTISINRYV